jgi:chromosome partitioning protein
VGEAKMKRAKIISFINYKGGVGKTTTTYHIGCGLAYYHGKRVLLVDIDPQTNLTFLCVDYESWKLFKERTGTIATLYDRFKRGKRPLQTINYIWQAPVGRDKYTKIQGLDLLPCDLDLLGMDLGGISPKVSEVIFGNPFEFIQEQARRAIREWLFLRQALSEVQNKYDYILIDCPPNLYLMTQNALVASDWYIVTTIPEYLSVIGLEILMRKVDEINKKVSHTANLAGVRDVKFAEIGGIIFVKVRVGGTIITRQHTAQMRFMKEKYPTLCFEAYTTEMIGYSEAAENQLPIWLTNTSNARNAAIKKEYERITDEFLRRFPS